MKRWEIGGNCITRSFIVVLLTKHYYNDQDKEDEMCRACSMNGGGKKCIYDIGGKARRKETTRKTKM
jgi:hypothetical protein